MERRTKVEFAHCLRHIVAAYSDAEVIRVVLDNLNTHKAASLYAAFPSEEARAIVRNIEFHYPPQTRQLARYRRKSVTMNQNAPTDSVIPGLTRNPTKGSAEPVVLLWIPAFARMTWLFLCSGVTTY